MQWKYKFLFGFFSGDGETKCNKNFIMWKQQFDELILKKIHGEVFAKQSQVLNPLRPAKNKPRMYYEGVQINAPFHKHLNY